MSLVGRGDGISHICQLRLVEFLARLSSLHLPNHAVLLLAFKLIDNAIILQLKVLIAIDELSDHDLTIFIGALELHVAGLEGLRGDVRHGGPNDRLAGS